MLSCVSIRDGREKEEAETAKKQVSMLTGRYLPFGYPFSLKKRTPPPFPHISSGEACVHTWGLKGRGRSSGKTTFSFGSSFFPEKRMCASLYTFYTMGNMCIHGDGKRNEKAEEKWLFSFYSSFSSAKRYVHLYTHLLIRGICAYMGREKERQNWRKSK